MIQPRVREDDERERGEERERGREGGERERVESVREGEGERLTLVNPRLSR